MKRKDYLTHIRSLSLADLKKEVLELEKKIQAQKLAIAFGKNKETRVIRSAKRDLARALTVASTALAQAANQEAMEK